MCQLTVFWKQTCSKVLLGRSGIERERRMWRKDEGVYQTLGNTRVNRHFSRGQTVNILSLWPNGLSQLTQLCHCSTNTCHRQFLNEDESHSNLIYGDWDLYFTWFPCVTEYSFSFDFFFFFKFSPPASAKTTLGSHIIQKQAVGSTGPLGRSWLTPGL